MSEAATGLRLEAMKQGDPDYSAKLHAGMVVALKRSGAGLQASQMMRRAVADGLRAYRDEALAGLHRGVAAYDGDGRLLGAMSLCAYPGDGCVEVKHLASTGEVSGVGKALLAEAVREALARGLGLSVLPEAGSEGFWRHAGLEGPAEGSEYWEASAQAVAGKMAPALGLGLANLASGLNGAS